MKTDLTSQLERYTKAVLDEQTPITAAEVRIPRAVVTVGDAGRPEPSKPAPRWRPLLGPLTAAAAALLLVGGAAWLTRSTGPEAEEASPTTALTTQSTLAGEFVVPPLVPDGSGVAPTAAAPPPDVAGALPGDDGSGPLPLGVVTALPDSVRLDFLAEAQGYRGYRDAQFIDPETGFGDGAFTADTPFHIRHGFAHEGPDPLGEGFDVALYVTPLDMPGEYGGQPTGDTLRYTSDFVIRGTTEACGPTYRTQMGEVTCEWFVHDFPDGLPGGRYAMWTMWEAPCAAWVGYGFTDSCADPKEVMSLFSSGFDTPFGSFGFGTVGGPDLTPDGSGAAPTGSAPPPDVAGARAGDDGSAPLPLGAVIALPDGYRLDFLYESDFCDIEPCYRDAQFRDPANPSISDASIPADTGFYVRHGFVNDGPEPLGEGFDVVLYITPLDMPGEFGGAPAGETVRYNSDYVIRGTTDACGPTYRTQTGEVTCEWFVHDFPEGLPEGRHAMWAVWEAPCTAWLDYGFIESCGDPSEVMTLFSSGFDTPIGAFSFGYGFEGPDLEPDGSGAAPTGGSPVPDEAGALAGDDGSGPFPLGMVTSVPDSIRLDFLFEFCWGGPCYRDAHFMDPDNPGFGSGVFTAGMPFHVRHGFVNEGPEPLGEGYDVVLFVTPLDEPGEFGGAPVGETFRYTSDYVIRGTTDACGPTYRTQDGPVTCEWFVHDFPDGLPEGRHAMWAKWEAPCAAWVDYGFTETCADPDEVISLFSSAFDAPFRESLAPMYDEQNQAGS